MALYQSGGGWGETMFGWSGTTTLRFNITDLLAKSGINVGQLGVMSGTISGTFACLVSGICADATISGISAYLSGLTNNGVFSGVVGTFTSSITIQGKTVIKDGDPIAVSSGEVHVISGVIGNQVRTSGNVWADVGIASGVANMWVPVGSMSGATVLVSGVIGANVSGSLQVSGTVSVSGQVIVTSGGTLPVGVLSGAMNISGGVTISGGITVSGGIQVSGLVGLQTRSSGNVLVDVGVASGIAQTYIPIASQSGTTVAVASGGVIPVGVISGAMNISGGITVSGGVTISGGVTVSGFVGALSGGTLPVAILSGAQNISGGVTVSGGVTISGGVTVSGGVSVSGFVGALSGGTLPITIVSGLWAPSKTVVSGGQLLTIASGLAVLMAITPVFLSSTQPTFSGQTINIADATSGMGAVASGIPVYSWTFGLHSGSIAGFIPPMLVDVDIICYSGIVVQSASGVRITVSYQKV